MKPIEAAMIGIETMLKCYEFEHHAGQVMPNTPDIEVHHFISKGKKYIIQVVLSEADKETIALIRQDGDD